MMKEARLPKETGTPGKDRFPFRLTDEKWKETIEKWGKDDPKTCPFFIINYDPNSIEGDRKKQVQEWMNFPVRIHGYEKGEYRDRREILHNFGAGKRLLITNPEANEEYEVMDTCEQPWCEATVDALFNGFPDHPDPLREKAPKVLLRGFGLGQQAQLIFDQLVARGAGELHIIELNHSVIESMRFFLDECKNRMESRFSYGKSKIKIFLHAGDAYQVTKDLAKKLIKEEEKFDIIISDTFPLSYEMRSINDLEDISDQVECLKRYGRFSFFPYSKGDQPNSTGSVTDRQQILLQPLFGGFYHRSRLARIDDPNEGIGIPPDYDFLQGADGPVKYLPVVICTDPIQQTSL